ncbi:MAG: hypothetical protein WC942_07915 [Clostridia bacterium]|jgi:hypothetical protein
MSIIPSGKSRLMVGQVISDPLNEKYNDGQESLSVDSSPHFLSEKALNDEVGIPDSNLEMKDNKSLRLEEENESTQSKTLSEHIVKILTGFGYPYRRLSEFKKKFVKEKIGPDGSKDIQIEIPDQYYPDAQGNIKTVENDEVISISKGISDKFDLNFNGADRGGGKWIIKFISPISNKDGKEESEIPIDNLDEIYGSPSSSISRKSTKDKKALTSNELIKEAKSDELINSLKKIIGR